MKFSQIKAYFIVDSRLFLREPMVLFFAFLFPAFMYTVFGFMFESQTYGVNARSYYDEYTASFIAVMLLNVALFNIGPGLVIYKERGFFRRLMLTPLPMSAVLSVTIARSFLIFLIGLVEMVLIGWFMFNRIPPDNGIQIITALIISAFALFTFGFMLGSFFKTSAGAFGNAILMFQIMLMLSGAAMPLETFPDIVQSATQFIPMTHVVTLLREAWNGYLFEESTIPTIFIVISFGVVSSLIAIRTFKWSAKQ